MGKNQINNNYLKFFTAVIMILFLWLANKLTSVEEEKCPTSYNKRIMPFEYRSLVIKKSTKIDKGSHLVPSLDMNNGGEILDFNVFHLGGDYSDWENIQVGDSIFKSRGSLDILIKKPWGDTIFIPFECPPSRSR